MRRHDLDWVRNLVILWLIPYHTAVVFDSFSASYVKGADTCLIGDVLILATNAWIMPLLFFITGLASIYALEKRSGGEYLKERTGRLLVPLLFGLLVLIPPQGYMARLSVGYTGGYLAHYVRFFTDYSNLTGFTGGFTPAHLWFLLYLYIISVVMLPLLKRLKRVSWRPVVAERLSQPGLYLLLSIPLLLLSALPEFGGKSLFVSCGYFLVGAILGGADSFQQNVRHFRWPALLLGAMMHVAMYVTILLTGIPKSITPAAVFVVLLKHVSILLVLSAVLGFVQPLRDKSNRFLAYLNGISMPLYVVHQSVLVVLAYRVVRTGWPIALQFIVIVLCTFAVSLALGHLLGRFKVTRFLMGMKSKPESLPLLSHLKTAKVLDE